MQRGASEVAGLHETRVQDCPRVSGALGDFRINTTGCE